MLAVAPCWEVRCTAPRDQQAHMDFPQVPVYVMVASRLPTLWPSSCSTVGGTHTSRRAVLPAQSWARTRQTTNAEFTAKSLQPKSLVVLSYRVRMVPVTRG